MDVATMRQYLESLGLELERRKFKEPVRVLMVGGAFMVSQLGNRASTQDIDIILLDFPATTDEPLDDRARAFRAAVWKIARDHKVPRHVINDDSTFFVRALTPTWPEGVLWLTSGMLQVFIPPKRYILALKLMTFRAKDRDDVLALLQDVQIATRVQAQELLDNYIDPQFYQEYEVPKTLLLLFGRE